MTLAALVIIMFSWLAIRKLEIKYFGKDYGFVDPLELLSRMSLEDIIKYRQHTIDGFLAVCILSMARLFP